MLEPDWDGAEDLLFERTQIILRQFAHEHPDELVSLFFYTVDSEFTGVGVNFDTPGNSLREAKAHQRYEIEYRDQLFAAERGLQEEARYFVAHPGRQIDDFNRCGPWKYHVFEFVELPAWEAYVNSSKEAPELEGRIITALWRVSDRLVKTNAFDLLRRMAPFRIAFAFHDDEMVVLRILDWPDVGDEGLAEPKVAPDCGGIT